MKQLQTVWLGTVPYTPAWNLQRAVAKARRSGELADDVLLLLEHTPVYTAGRNTEVEHLKKGRESLENLSADFVEVDRGGSVTFHGPGQLIAYPIIKVNDSFPSSQNSLLGDVIAYVRALEFALQCTLREVGIDTQLRPPHTGVWVEDRKLAAIGVKVAGGVTTHGVALNVCTDSSWFDSIVPCGIADAKVGSYVSEGVTSCHPKAISGSLAFHIAQQMGAQVSSKNIKLGKIINEMVKISSDCAA